MANGDQVQGGQQGGGTYSEEDVMALMNEAARRAAEEAIKSAPRREEEEDEDIGSVINPKVVKQLKDTVAVFTALKDLSSNPLQRTIEETVGGMAASVVQSAFSPRGPPPKKDIVETLLNSQFAYGLGSGLGQRAPELVETMGRTFGTDKAGQMIENVIGKYGSGGGGGGGSSGGRQLTASPSPPSSPSSSQSEQKIDKQSEKELLLSLDPNNPEHVSAYAETQGGLPVDVARKMLMIHQDAFIEQMKREGMNIDQISTQRGSHSGPRPSPKQESSPSPHVPEQTSSPRSQHPQRSVQPEMPPNIDSGIDTSDIYGEPVPSNPEHMQYTDYQDVSQVGQDRQHDTKNDQQIEMMKSFATDIGKIMGELTNKIESLNNTVFTLQSEVNIIKRGSSVQSDESIRSPPVHTRVPSEISRDTSTVSTISKEPYLETFDEPVDTIIRQSPKIEKKRDTYGQPKSSEDFFEEDIKSSVDFLKELGDDAKRDIEKLEQQKILPSVPPVVSEKRETELSSVVTSNSSPPTNIQQISIESQKIVKPIRKSSIIKKPEHDKSDSDKSGNDNSEMGEGKDDKEINSNKEV